MQDPVVSQPETSHDAHVHASLDQLNITFAQFLSAEADMTTAGKEGDRTYTLLTWQTKRQAADTYIQAWETLAP